MKSGSHFSFFLRCEPGTGASLLKMWRKKSTFLRSEPGTGAGRVDRNCGEREIGTADFSQSMRMRVSLAFCFALFHIITLFFTLFPSFSSFFFFPFVALFSHLFPLSPPFSHYFPFFSPFSFSFSHSFSHFRWPGRGRSLAALPCLPLPYLTSPLLSSPSLTLF